jgi:hypothetical protein
MRTSRRATADEYLIIPMARQPYGRFPHWNLTIDLTLKGSLPAACP